VTLRILLTGAGGQLGLEVQKAAARPGADLTVVPLTRSDLDITDPEAVRHALARQKPDILVNAAAYTNVDRAESEPGLALAVNRDGAENLAAACSQANVPLIHVSTDYVFDGRGTRPYREEDPVSPLNAYGRSKAEGEDRIRARHPEHVILRTSWLYATHGRNFLTTMLRLGRERDTLSVVNDQVGCPTWARDLARAILQIAEALPRTPSPWGTYHCSNQGQTTWYGFAEAIFELAPQALALRVQNVHPISTEDYPTPAARPPYSVLNCARIHRSFGISLPPWRESVRTALRIPRKR
jgi:dTDP-4-dehydrorhamnose reductase